MQITTFSLQANEPELREVDNAEPTPAWECVAEGRYRPRRIRGSYLGRELG